MTIAAEKQKLSTGRRVELFDFDATSLGGTLYRFVSSYKNPQPITWQTNIYTPQPIDAKGFEVTGRGTLPRPTLTLSNASYLVSNIIAELGRDPLGAKITRWVTFETFLDDGDTPDPDEHFIPEIFIVWRKKKQNKILVDFELSAAIDQQGRELPGRQVIREACSWIYRKWNGSEFDYTKATCPYAGTDYFTKTGNTTMDPAADVCGKKLSDCRARFGSGSNLPFGGFPAVAKVR